MWLSWWRDVTHGRPERLRSLVLPDCLNLLHNDSIVLQWQPKCLATTFCASPAWSIPIAGLSLWRRFRQSGNTRDRRRSGRPCVTSRHQDNHIRLVHMRNWFQTSNLTARSIPGLRPISSRTIRNRLREHNIRPRHPVLLHGGKHENGHHCCLGEIELICKQDVGPILYSES
jgi:hypothetical protein